MPPGNRECGRRSRSGRDENNTSRERTHPAAAHLDGVRPPAAARVLAPMGWLPRNSVVVGMPSRARVARTAHPQYWSELTTSPPLRVPRAHQAWRPTVSLTNLTEPSAKAMSTPPGWLLLGG